MSTVVDLQDLVTSEQMKEDKENELPRWVEYLEEVFDKWVKIIINDASSVEVGDTLNSS